MLPASALKEPKVSALQENYFAHLLFFPERLPSYTVLKAKELIITNSGLADASYNHVLRARLQPATAQKAVHSAQAYFGREQMPFEWIVSPSDTPKELTQTLEQAGLEQVSTRSGMICSLAERHFEQAELRVERVLNMTQMSQVADIMFDAYGDGPSRKAYWQHLIKTLLRVDDYEQLYIGYADEKPVCYGRLTYYAGVAGIHQLTTVRAHQRAGLGTAMLYELLMRAQADGYENAVTVCSDAVQPFFHRFGCEVICDFDFLG